MTMIACTINNGYPIVLSDILLSSTDRPEGFSSPTIADNLMNYLSEDRMYYPLGLKQKISIIADNLCFAFSGFEYLAKGFLEDLRRHFGSMPNILVNDVMEFLQHYGLGELKDKLSFVLVLIEKVENGFQAIAIPGGHWSEQKTAVFDDITVLGSGAEDFLRSADRVDSNYTPRPQNARESIGTNLSLVGSILARERSQLHTFANHWGGGFELVFFNGEKFARFDDICYVYNHAGLNEFGYMDLPAAFKVTHYRYIDGFLLITDIEAKEISTEEKADVIVYNYAVADCRPFIVPSIEFRGEIDWVKYTSNLSFSSKRAVLGYILEGTTYTYFPASFHDQGVEVDYVSKTSVQISIRREFIEHVTDIANSRHHSHNGHSL
jgi:hypothetical protein